MASEKTLAWRPDIVKDGAEESCTGSQHSPTPTPATSATQGSRRSRADDPTLRAAPPVERRDRSNSPPPQPKRRDKGKHHQRRHHQSRRVHRSKHVEMQTGEGYGRLYIEKQIQQKTPMVFACYQGCIEGFMLRRLTYALDICVDGKQRRIEKIDIKYMYKRRHAELIEPWMEIRPELKAKQLPPVEKRDERFDVDNKLLSQCCKRKIPICLILRGGEAIAGEIDWFSQYEIKLNLPNGKGIVVFRHSLVDFGMQNAECGMQNAEQL